MYPDHTVRIPQGSLPGQFVEDLGTLSSVGWRQTLRLGPVHPAVPNVDFATSWIARNAWTATVRGRKVSPTISDPFVAYVKQGGGDIRRALSLY